MKKQIYFKCKKINIFIYHYVVKLGVEKITQPKTY